MMPTFEFTSPDGKTYEVEGPEGATEEQAFQMLQTELGETAKPAEPAAPKQSKFERAQSDFVAGLKKLPKDAAALADMVASIPGQLIGVGADMGMRAVALGHGIDNRVAGIMAQKFRQDIADPLSNPIEKLMHAFGYDKGYTDANVAQAMNKVGGWMEKGGEYVERQTGGLLTKEDVDSLANTALATIGAQGTSLALKKRLDKLGRVSQEDLPSLTDKQKAAEVEAPKPAPKPVVNAATIDELLGIKPAPERAAANKAKRAETRGAFVDDPDLADYYAAKAEERLSNEVRLAEERAVAEQNAAAKFEALPTEQPTPPAYQTNRLPDTLLAGPGKAVAGSAADNAALRSPGAQEAMRKLTGDTSQLTKVERTTAIFLLAEEIRKAKAAQLPEASGAPRTGLREGKTLEELRAGTSALDSAVAKVKDGRKFDLTAEERVALKSLESEYNKPGIQVPRGMRGAVDAKALAEMEEFLKGLGIENPKAVAMTMLASVDEAKSTVHNNASGESAASLEAQSRLATEKAKGQTRLLVEKDGTVRPLVGVDAVDQVAKPGQVILQKGVGKDEWTTLSKGDDVGGAAEARARSIAGKESQGYPDLKTGPNSTLRNKNFIGKDGRKYTMRLDVEEGELRAYDSKGKVVGTLAAAPRTGYSFADDVPSGPADMHVLPEHRRNGVNTAMNELAREAIPGYQFKSDTFTLEGQAWYDSIKSKPKNQFGKIDAADAAKLAALATGAVVGSQLTEDPLFGAITGAAFTAAGGYALSKGAKPGLKSLAQGADYVAGNLSTRIGNISQPILHRAREYERGVLERTHKLLDRAHPFIEQLSKVKGEKGEALARAILTNDPIAVKAALDAVGNSKLTTEFRNVQGMLEEVGKELQAHGRLGTLRENYFPRVVKDLDGLMSALGSEVRTKLQKDLAAAEVDAVRRGQILSDLDRTVIVNRSLLSIGDALKGKPGFSKARQIAAVTKELQPFYASPVESLHSYLSQASKDLEKAKFFGRDLVKAEGKVDLDASIGRVVARELDAGNITFAQAEELGSMLRSRFGPGEASSAGLIQDVKNMINAGLLGNVVSAATQLGDVGTTFAIQGLRPTMESVVRQLTGRNQINMKAFGLADHISEEFVSTRKSAKFLNATFKLGLFTGVDAFGKNVGLNAAHLKLRDLTKTVGGMRKLEAKYGDAFGPDFQTLVQELRSGKMGDQTKAALFSELSDMQPISRLEVPQAYLDMPNGRAVYMLKTFMLKQFDIARRIGYNKIKEGYKTKNSALVAEGIKNLTRYAITLGISGATTDMIRQWLMGQTIDFDASDLSKNILKTFGWSEYVLDQAKKGEPVKAVGGTLLPPYKMFDDLYKASGGGEMSEAAREKARNRAVQYVPVFGKLVESHLLGGAERRDAQAEKRKEKAQ